MIGRAYRTAFTLVELLVAITIIGVLVALLLPAVQAAREAARRVHCKNNLRQLALAAITHHEQISWFPTGGWSVYWVGDRDRGFGRDQPGGWTYNILPFLEEANVHGLPADGRPDWISPEQLQGGAQLMQATIPSMYCPSRGPVIAHSLGPGYPWGPAGPVGSRIDQPPNTHLSAASGALDYAINAGDFWSGMVVGPTTLGPSRSYPWCSDSFGNRIDPIARRSQCFEMFRDVTRMVLRVKTLKRGSTA